MGYQNRIVQELSTIALVAILSIGAGCSNEENTVDTDTTEDSVSLVDNELSYLQIEGSAILSEKDAAVDTWCNNIYVPKLMEYEGLKKIQRYKNLNGVVAANTLPGYVTFNFYTTEDELMGMANSPAAAEALSSMATAWPNGEIVVKLNEYYKKTASLARPGADTASLYVSVIGADLLPEKEELIATWYKDTYIPRVMKYTEMAKIVRYQKLAGAGMSNDSLPKYIILFYYFNMVGMNNIYSNQDFTAAESDRTSRWNDAITLKCVVNFESKAFVKK